MQAPPPSSMPILYSACVFPGTGQFMQKRMVAGLLYSIACGIAVLVFLAVFTRYFHPIAQGWADRLIGDHVSHPDAPPARTLLKPGLYLLAIYFANVYDVTYAWYRARLAWRKDSPREPGSTL